MFINYTFSPQHLSFLNMVFYMFLLLFYRILAHYSEVIIICEVIINLFMIFSTLLFSEMIIINKWGLNDNTIKQFLIEEKEEKEELDDENKVSELINENKENE